MTTIVIEGEKHEWIESSECTPDCKKNKMNITWCDECDRAFCKAHEDYHNDYATGVTLCEECWRTGKHWEKERKGA